MGWRRWRELGVGRVGRRMEQPAASCNADWSAQTIMNGEEIARNTKDGCGILVLEAMWNGFRGSDGMVKKSAMIWSMETGN